MWSVDFSWWIISFCTTALEFVCFACALASIIICHLHKIDKCHTCWQWYKYLALPWWLRLTNLQRPPLDLLTTPGFMGNDDTDGLTASLPSGHLEQLSWWLIEKETHHWPCIDFFTGSPPSRPQTPSGQILQYRAHPELWPEREWSWRSLSKPLLPISTTSMFCIFLTDVHDQTPTYISF